MKPFQTVFRILPSLGIFLFSITGGQAAVPAGEVFPEQRGPELVRPLSINMPVDIWHLVQPDAVATVLLRIDTDGRVIDWVSLDIPHWRLVGALDRSLMQAEFLPAIQEGQPVIVDTAARIPVGEVGAYTPLSLTIAEHIEMRISALDRSLYQLRLSLPGEIDEPLQLLSKGESWLVLDENGKTLAGEVMVEFYIDQEGRPRMVRVLGNGHPALQEAAILMVQEFRFRPPSRKGRPTVVKARIPVVFD